MRVEDFTYVISGVGLIALVVVGTRRRLGWLLSATSNALLATYGLITDQRGFAVVPLATITVQMWHIWRWRHEGWRRLDPKHRCRCSESDTVLDTYRVNVLD